jgi:hypothetical protein
MTLGSRLFRMLAARAPRVRGFSSRFYFGHPFLDAWFAWFPLNQIQYDGAAVGEVFNVAARNASPAPRKRITTAAEGAGAHCQLDNFPLARQIVFDWIEELLPGARAAAPTEVGSAAQGRVQ